MASCSESGRVLPWMCALACRVSRAEGPEPAREKTENSTAVLRGRYTMKTQQAMAEQARADIAGLALVRKQKERVEDVGMGRAVREATTGRVVAVLPTVWATAQVEASEREMAGVNETSERHTQTRVRPRPELAFYRKYTEAMLRRYGQMCMQAGRVPSLMGQTMFRGKVTHYRVRNFEDVVIFRLDVERCLAKLEEGERQLIRRIALQEYTQGEAAALLRMSLRGCVRKYGEALDRLTEIFLKMRLLEPLQGVSSSEGFE